MEEMFANSVNEELVLWQSLKQNEGWKVFLKFIKSRQEKLIKGMLADMREGKLDEAQNRRSGYDELNRILSLVSNRMKELIKESNKEE